MGGVARHELAAAVSEAGGLGTLAGARAAIARELEAARALTSRPIAVNLLLPYLRPADAAAASAADVVVTFWGAPRRLTGGTWIHQCGSVAEALAAEDAGADAVIAQGVEAGGHVRGSLPLFELLERVRAEVSVPVLAAGGIVDREGVTSVLAARASPALQARTIRAQRPSSPFVTPQPPTDDGPDNLVEAGALYAGAGVRGISDVRPAAQLVRELTP